MKITGHRGRMDALVRVVTNGEVKSLPLRLDLRNHSPTGFEWGYRGSGPAQLALAILACVTQDDAYACAAYQDFKDEFVAPLREDAWELTAAEIEAWVVAHPVSEEDKLRYLPARRQAEIIDREIVESTPCEQCGGRCEYSCTRPPESYRARSTCAVCHSEVAI